MVTRILSLQYLNHATIQTPPALEKPLFCRSGSASLSVEQREKGVIRWLAAQHSKSANGPRIPPGAIHIAYLSIQFEFDNEKKTAGLIDLPLIRLISQTLRDCTAPSRRGGIRVLIVRALSMQ